MPRFTDESEFYYLAFTAVFVLLMITIIDWVFTIDVIQAAGASNAPIYGGYYLGMVLVGLTVIAPIALFVYIVRREWSSLVVWTLALAIPLISGSEDLLYYAVWLAQPENYGNSWSTWTWLDANPFVAWTNPVFGSQNVTTTQLWISAGIGWLVVAVVVYAYFELAD